MLNNKDAVYIIIWAIVLGISFAVIYTNFQRSAISRFIKSLLTNNCNSAESAKTLEELGLKGISNFTTANAVKTQNGLKRIIEFVAVEEFEKEEAEMLLYGNKKIYRYFLNQESDKELVQKKYGYIPLSPLKIAVTIFLIAITAFVATKSVDLLEGYVSSRPSEQEQEEQAQISDSKNQNTSNHDNNSVEDNTISEENIKIPKPHKSDQSVEEEEQSSLPSRPSIPMGPTK